MREDDERAEGPNLLARSRELLLGFDVPVSTRSSPGLSLDDSSRGVDGVELRSSSKYALLYVGLS